MSAWVKPTGGDPVKHWWGMDNDAQFMRFPGKAGDYKVVVEVKYPEKNWDSRVRIYAHEADLDGDNVPELTDLELERDPKLDDCHAVVGNYENLDEWRDLTMGRQDDWF